MKKLVFKPKKIQNLVHVKVPEKQSEKHVSAKVINPLSHGFVCASDVQTKKIDWFWKGYIPKGSIVLIEGDPGEGKSNITSFLAACVSAGIPLPDSGETEPRKVFIVNGEDPTSLQVARLQAAGGDKKQVLLWPDPEASYMSFYLPQRIEDLEDMAAKHDVGLIIIDTVNAHLDPKLSIDNYQHMKPVLQRVNKLAQDLNIPIIMVRHLKKARTGSAIVSGLGSIGIVGSARAAFIVGPDPDGSGDKIFACSKSNFAQKPKSLRFRIVSATVKSSDGTDIATSKIEWLGESSYTADDLCKPEKAPLSPAVAEAMEFLEDLLAEGPMPQNQIFIEAKEVGISEASLRRAQKKLGIKPKKIGSQSIWALPESKE